MRFLQQLSHTREVSVVEGVHKLADPRDLRVDMAAPFRMTGYGLAPALVVGRRGQRAMLAGVDDRDRYLVREWHHLVLQRGAVEQQHATTPSERGGELIHQADLHAGRLLLGSLAGERRHLAIEIGLQSGGDGDKERRRRADPSVWR